MSLINREELLRRLKLHGRRKDGKTVIPEWVQVAIKEVEHMPEGAHATLDVLLAQKAYWIPCGVRLANSADIPQDQARGYVIQFKCSYCGRVQDAWTGAACECGAILGNGDIDCSLNDVLDRFSFWRPFPNCSGGVAYACQKCGYYDGGTDATCPNCEAIMLNGTRLHNAEYRDVQRYETMYPEDVSYDAGLEKDIERIDVENFLN